MMASLPDMLKRKVMGYAFTFRTCNAPSIMQTRTLTLRFLTPAFLGNAEQSGAWRTPPIKALLRQWWRVAYAASENFDVDVGAMRHEEGLLFGHAWLEDDSDAHGNTVAARKSAVRLRLNALEQQSAWAVGSQQGVAPLNEGLDTSYAWFGLINRGNGLPNRSGIKAEARESTRQLSLAFPDELESRMEEVMTLIHAFGLLGSRSRGGWGALHVEGMNILTAQDMQTYARRLADCLNHDWAMSLAKDNTGLLVWQGTQVFDTWDKAMTFIARCRKAVRTALKLPDQDLRPALGFATPGRMSSPLRWKVMASAPRKLTVRAFALPHAIPAESGVTISATNLKAAWNTVSNILDGTRNLQRLK
jgi:CRISPR-associated protein Cmr1